MSAFDHSSCNISLSGTVLSATCKKAGGNTEVHSTINLNDCIANINGCLVARSGGNFAASCSNITLNGTTLSCMATDENGSKVPAQINLSSFIANYDGELVASE